MTDHITTGNAVLVGIVLTYVGVLVLVYKQTRKQQTYDPTRSIYDDLD